MNIGILGTGHVANLLGTAWSGSEHSITLGSRHPAARQLDFPVKSLEDTVREADVVVNAIVGAEALATIRSLDADVFAGKTVIDVANASTATGDLSYPESSLAEHIQAALPDAHVVKSMNTAPMTTIVNPSAIAQSSVFVSGDDQAAKAAAAALLIDLGWPKASILDLGALQSARGPEHYFVMLGSLSGALKTENFNVLVIH